MFGYIDPTIREQLIKAGQLIRIDANGRRIEIDNESENGDLTLNVLGPIPLPVDVFERRVVVSWYAFVRRTELRKAEEIAGAISEHEEKRLFPLLSSHMSVNSVLIHGEPARTENPLVRVHSCCMTGDVFGSKRCECGPQFELALDQITRSDAGALVYMSGHEGRGIGLWGKAITYLLQDAGQDTYEANISLGLPADSRDFTDAAAVLLHFLGGNRRFRLLSNNPKKIEDLHARGLTEFSVEKHITGVSRYNQRYLRAKRDWGHKLDLQDIEPPADE